MRDVLGPGTHLGYGTNVHAGATLPEICANLERYAAAVKRAVSPDEPLGVGLWLPAAAVANAAFADSERLRDTLRDNGLYVFTLNGFPYGDFHGPVAKHEVYRPDWADPRRFEYTLQLVIKLAALTAGAEGSISTLPIGWKADFASPARLEAAAHALRRLAVRLHELQDKGLFVHVDLEPEPGCVLQTSEDLVAFFQRYLLCETEAEHVRRHIRVCHDVCHTAVMFESQTEAFRRYTAAGIEVGKVQLSSALRVRFDEMDAATAVAALEEYRRFVEPRFLHQTVVRGVRASGPPDERPRGSREATIADATVPQTVFYEDLPDALAAHAPTLRTPSASEGPVAAAREPPATGVAGSDAAVARGDDDAAATGEWRTHFHVPIFLDRIGLLETTQAEIVEALQAARRYSNCRHFEVETYAWSVLPPELRPALDTAGVALQRRSRSDRRASLGPLRQGPADLAAGIAQELQWLRRQIERLPPQP